MSRIQRFSHPVIQQVRQLLASKTYRAAQRLFVLEHQSQLQWLMTHQPDAIAYILAAPEWTPLVPTTSVSIMEIPTDLLLRVSELASSAGCLAVVHQPVSSGFPAQAQMVVVVDGVRLPSNLGAIIRNAAAFNADAVVMLPHTADPFHPESVRASVGHVMTVPLFQYSYEEAKTNLAHMTCIGLDAHANIELPESIINPPVALFLGSESHGLSKNVPPMQMVRIPIQDKVESLNVAVSSGIVLYELRNIIKLPPAI